ncbi:Acyl-CoA-binding domain-containing protein 4 [Tetrabaena socialis]|uniref:Acyl-CoA-binding domain-containing protein 4 n=1 Tax=Tetrabaena socialis TaxID=47790 RepID=A0A2J8AEJ9_9CHLO|nr:Acyl-CoA-binding domain-containing protein 4 [Tetrabaena socialis]|eukprot:PNH10944.1 Acyl-CoA-binding domain-containing protein 4 [Tetrabaena socialis]
MTATYLADLGIQLSPPHQQQPSHHGSQGRGSGAADGSAFGTLHSFQAQTSGGGVPTSSQFSQDGPPTSIFYHYPLCRAAATGSRIWFYGGQQGRKFLRTLFCLDTDTCTWTRRESDAHPPARAGHAMVTVHGSVVYMFGGQGKRLYNDLYKLDPATGAFSEVEAAGKPPSPRRGHSLVWDGRDYLVCFGGVNQTSTDAQLSVFSLSRGAWFVPQAFGPAPCARTQHTAQLLSPGIILIFGGCNSGGTFFNDCAVLDTATFSWTKPAVLNTPPAPRYHHCCAVVNGRALIHGGINSKQTFEGVVVLETKWMADISNVAEELMRMTTLDAGAAPAHASSCPSTAASAYANSPPPSVRGLWGNPTSVAPACAFAAAAAASAGAEPQRALQPAQPAGLAPLSAATLEHGFSSTKSLDSVKIQLTDLLLRRNLEEQHAVTARKAETTESLLVGERDARVAATKEVLQYKLLLAEAEASAAASQQQLQAALSRSTKDAAALAELRGQVEVMQAKLCSREEELQEARQLQDGLVKELGIMASRYSRLALLEGSSQDGGAERASASTRRSSLNSMAALTNGSQGASSPSSVAALHTAGQRRGTAAAAPLSCVSFGPQASSRATTGAVDPKAVLEPGGASTSCSVPLPNLGGPTQPAQQRYCPAALSTHSAAGASAFRGPTPPPPRPSVAAAAGSCRSCCQQLLAMLSESEVHRAALIAASQGLNGRLDELTAHNEVMLGQLRQMLAEPCALEPLPLRELEELERKLDASGRVVREALLLRKIADARQRSTAEQAQCAVCMEEPKAVVFNCGHQSCEPCSRKLTSCPFCRVAIAARIRLFDA